MSSSSTRWRSATTFAAWVQFLPWPKSPWQNTTHEPRSPRAVEYSTPRGYRALMEPIGGAVIGSNRPFSGLRPRSSGAGVQTAVGCSAPGRSEVEPVEHPADALADVADAVADAAGHVAEALTQTVETAAEH